MKALLALLLVLTAGCISQSGYADIANDLDRNSLDAAYEKSYLDGELREKIDLARQKAAAGGNNDDEVMESARYIYEKTCNDPATNEALSYISLLVEDRSNREYANQALGSASTLDSRIVDQVRMTINAIANSSEYKKSLISLYAAAIKFCA